MSLNEYLAKNGIPYLNEGHMYQKQANIIDTCVDWSKVKTILEIGFNGGHSADFFLSHRGVVSMVSFELQKEKHVIVGKKYIDEKYPGRHEMVWGDSTMTVPKFESRKFDLIFIDGGHEVEVARADLNNCMRFAHPGTVVIMDDVMYEYTWAKKYTVGPTRAWQELIRNSVLEETFHFDITDGIGMSIGRYKVFHEYSVPKPRVVDAFMFYNELEMLKYRLTVMGPYVDRFVICECPVSFAGKPKPLYFQENKHLFEPWLDKITHLVWKGYRNDPEESWYNENNQRNHLLEGLRDLNPNDIVIISDLDEIVSPKVLEQVDDVLGSRSIINFSMDLYYYNIETRCPKPWTLALAARYSFIRDLKPHPCRKLRRTDFVIENAGWHMSFFGNEKFIINKTKNYAHLETNDTFEDDDIDKVREIVNKGVDFACCNVNIFKHVPRSQNNRLPPRLDILPHECI